MPAVLNYREDSCMGQQHWTAIGALQVTNTPSSTATLGTVGPPSTTDTSIVATETQRQTAPCQVTRRFTTQSGITSLERLVHRCQPPRPISRHVALRTQAGLRLRTRSPVKRQDRATCASVLTHLVTQPSAVTTWPSKVVHAAMMQVLWSTTFTSYLSLHAAIWHIVVLL